MLNQNLLLQFFKIRTKLFTPKVEKKWQWTTTTNIMSLS